MGKCLHPTARDLEEGRAALPPSYKASIAALPHRSIVQTVALCLCTHARCVSESYKVCRFHLRDFGEGDRTVTPDASWITGLVLCAPGTFDLEVFCHKGNSVLPACDWKFEQWFQSVIIPHDLLAGRSTKV
eukprot:s1441_g5.t1